MKPRKTVSLWNGVGLRCYNLVAWAAHPYRTKREVLDAIRKAIRISRGAPLHRGGWRISSGPVRAA